jgi:putative tricarboxylic transport membrane protein
MIPLLSLGVPGDAVTAVLLGAFVIQGLQPGPLLYKEHIDIVYQIFASMVLAVVSLVLSVLKVREIEKRLAEMETTFEKQVGEA